jgi:hypothetical protein
MGVFMYRKIEETELRLDKTLGYLYFIDKNHPLSHKQTGKVYYHRHVASVVNNRWLLPEEVVHHVDSDKTNNTIENLLVLNSSEHALLHLGTEYTKLTCPVCSKDFLVTKKASDKRITCSIECSRKKSTKWNISKEELELLIWNASYTDISKKYPISDTGVKKKAKSLGCQLPPPYFFSKTEEYRKEQRNLYGIPDLSL